MVIFYKILWYESGRVHNLNYSSRPKFSFFLCWIIFTPLTYPVLEKYFFFLYFWKHKSFVYFLPGKVWKTLNWLIGSPTVPPPLINMFSTFSVNFFQQKSLFFIPWVERSEASYFYPPGSASEALRLGVHLILFYFIWILLSTPKTFFLFWGWGWEVSNFFVL